MTDQSAFDRGHDAGVIAGEIAARLAGHDTHFKDLNGSVTRLAAAQEQANKIAHDMAMQIQRLTDQSIADAATRITLAEALEKAEKKRIEVSESRFAPVNRVTIVLGAVVGVAALVSLLIFR